MMKEETRAWGRGSAQGRGLAQALTQQAVVGQGLRAREVEEGE